jgi:DNA polymerase-3 subunit delta'
MRELWLVWARRAQARTLPHALLLAGSASSGKSRFAECLAAALLCQHPQPEGFACGRCTGCRMLAAGTHADFLAVAPEEEGRAIKIDQIRAHNQFMNLTPQYGGYRVSRIGPAERMTIEAANSLLKTLEEPAARSVLILITTRPASLPATVRSRCQRIDFRPPPRDQALAWLRAQLPAGPDHGLLLDLAEGVPFAALQLAEGEAMSKRAGLFQDLAALAAGEADPVTVAEGWASQGASEALHWLCAWLMDMIRLKASASQCHVRNRDLAGQLGRWAQQAPLPALYGHLDRAAQGRQLLTGPSNVTPRLLLEDTLIAWTELMDRRSG